MRHPESGRLQFVAAVVALFIAVAMLAACGESNGETIEFDAEQVINDAAARLDDARSFHFVLTHDRGETRIIQDMRMTRAEGDVLRPASIRADLTVSAAGQNIALKMTGIDDRTWLSNPFDPSQWQLLPGVTSTDVLDLQRLTDVLMGMESVVADGTDSVAGVECYRMRGSVDSDAFIAMIPEVAVAGETVEVELWVGRTDLLPRQLVVRGRLNPDESGEVTRRIVLSAFDAPVSIEPPG